MPVVPFPNQQKDEEKMHPVKAVLLLLLALIVIAILIAALAWSIGFIAYPLVQLFEAGWEAAPS